MTLTSHRSLYAAAIARPLRTFVALLLLLVSACMPGNENSVIDRPLANDGRMAGVWVASLGEDEAIALRVKTETPEALLVDIAVLSDEPGIAHYRAARTRIGSHDILELTETEASDKAGGGVALNLPHRFFVGYVFDDAGRLVVSLQNELDTPLEKAVKAGTLSARTERRGRNSTVVVTAPTQALRDFLAATPKPFGTPPLAFAKVPPPQKK